MTRVVQTNHSGLPGARAHSHQTDCVMAYVWVSGSCSSLPLLFQKQLRLPRALFMDENALAQSRKLTCPRQHSWLSCFLALWGPPLTEKFPVCSP